MFRRTCAASYWKSNRHLTNSNPGRRWVPHKIAFGIFATAMGFVTTSYVRAKYAPFGEERFAGGVVEIVATWLPYALLSRLGGEVAASDLIPRQGHQAMIRMIGGSAEDGERFDTLQEYFERTFAPGSRPLPAAPTPYVSPCDGTVMSCVEMTTEDRPMVVQVKRHFYAVDSVLRDRVGLTPRGYRRYTAVIQMDSKDIHRVHAPANMDVLASTHVPGTMLPISISCAKWLPQLYLTNERVALLARPKDAKPDKSGRYPVIGMALVGGFCKGRIKLDFDDRIETNTDNQLGTSVRRAYRQCPLKQGDALGHFEMGSAVVLVFDSPTEAIIEPGQRLKMGEALVAAHGK